MHARCREIQQFGSKNRTLRRLFPAFLASYSYGGEITQFDWLSGSVMRESRGSGHGAVLERGGLLLLCSADL
jgi:hypothetical protein